MRRLLLPLLLAGMCLRAEDVPARDRVVIVMSIDGLPAYAFTDPRLPAPTLQRLAREGAMAVDGMRPVNPTVTWPNHTTLVTGVTAAVHQVLFNGMLVRHGPHAPVTIEPWLPEPAMVHAPTVYDLAHQAGLTTAQVDWVAIYKAPTITWEFPERPGLDVPLVNEMIGRGLISADDILSFLKPSQPWRDQTWARAAAYLIREHKPNLLLYHLLNLDSIHHRYGPRTLASYTGIAFADARVKEILEAIDAAGLRDRATLLVLSDHGFKAVRKQLHPAVLLRQAGFDRDACFVPEGGTAMLYVTNPARRAEVLARTEQMCRGVEGVARVLTTADFPPLGLPTPAQSDQAPDLVLAAADGYAFAGGAAGPLVTDLAEGGSHGYLNSDPEMHATFIAWGYGIKPGARMSIIENVDVAPTVARLLGLQMQNVQGVPLAPILK